MRRIETLEELLNQFQDSKELSTLLGVHQNAISVWKSRGYIPANHADLVRKYVVVPIHGRVFRMTKCEDFD